MIRAAGEKTISTNKQGTVSRKVAFASIQNDFSKKTNKEKEINAKVVELNVGIN